MSFSEFAGEAKGIEEWVQDKEFSYESSAVKYLLKCLGLSDKKTSIEDLAEEGSGKRRLTFAWFHRAYPRCPCRLSSRLLPSGTSKPPRRRTDRGKVGEIEKNGNSVGGPHEWGLLQLNNPRIREDDTVDPFFKSLAFKEFEKVQEEGAEESELVGMVFRCGSFHFVLHGGAVHLETPGSRLVKTAPTGDIFTLEPFSQFIRDQLLENRAWMAG